jgi:type IV pilus assembly protein PilA
MLQQMKKRLKNEKGLTLIELLAVIVILAIIAAIAIPAIGNIIDNSRYNAVKSDATNVLNAANIYFAERSLETEVTVQGLIDEGYLENAGNFEGEDGAKVAKESPNTISAGPIEYSSGKSVTFTGATLEDINNDDQSGSDEGERTIPATS